MIVVDASAVVDALTTVGGTEHLRAHLAAEHLNAPVLLDFEVVSALRGLTLGGHLTPARAEDVLTDFEQLPIRRWAPADSLRRRAFELGDVVSAYDAAYVALAEALDCPLVTRDRRLARAASHLAAVGVW